MHILAEYRGRKYTYYLLHSLLQYCINNRTPPSHIIMGGGGGGGDHDASINNSSDNSISIDVLTPSLVSKLLQEGFEPSSSHSSPLYAIHVQGDMEKVMGYIHSKYDGMV